MYLNNGMYFLISSSFTDVSWKPHTRKCLWHYWPFVRGIHWWPDMWIHLKALHWRHNEPDCVSNHQPHDCLLNRLFRRWSKKTSKLRVTGLCAGNSPGTGEFPAQMVSNAENVSIWWRHHGMLMFSLSLAYWTTNQEGGYFSVYLSYSNQSIDWMPVSLPYPDITHVDKHRYVPRGNANASVDNECLTKKCLQIPLCLRVAIFNMYY